MLVSGKPHDHQEQRRDHRLIRNERPPRFFLMTVSILRADNISTGNRRIKMLQLVLSLTTEPLLVRPSDVGLDNFLSCSNASTFGAASVIPCVVTADSTGVKVTGITSLPATSGNLTGDYTINIIGT